MNITPIEWCDETWNPVTGCKHGCPYCYARNITHRFGFRIDADPGHGLGDTQRVGKECECNRLHILREKPNNSYPYGFDPTFHRYRLNEPQKYKKPQNTFVCSMADLFGDWVPDQWIKEVFDACKAAPQHRFLFLTKNPNRLYNLADEGLLPTEHWYGSSIENDQQMFRVTNDNGGPERKGLFAYDKLNTFVSIEPLLDWWAQGSDMKTTREVLSTSWISKVKWVIIGAQTGNKKGKVIPKREWIANILSKCNNKGIPVFMKDSIAPIWGEPLIREFPWGKG